MTPPSKFNNILEALNSRINNAAIKSNRTSDDITLVAVTKSFPPNIWERAIKHNLTTLAENRIQEAKEKLKFFKFFFCLLNSVFCQGGEIVVDGRFPNLRGE